jgi:glycerol-3-phosphate acyltransferase PlsX
VTSHTPDITIAVDAMGGDHAPGVVVEGALNAIREANGRLAAVLVGQEDLIARELDAHAGGVPSSLLRVVNAPDVITMNDAPNAALRTKKSSSIAVGLTLHRDAEVQGFVSAGNTGAVLSASTLILGRVEGVGRPTIGALLPTTSQPCLLLDAGANVDCKPLHLFEFAVMGSIYMSALRGIPRPRVGLLNIGEEDAKGNETAREAFALLKFGESIPSFLRARFLAFAGTSLANKLVAIVARNGLRTVMREMDYQEHGGVPLLGVRGVSIIGHGGSTAKAIANMMYRAEEMIVKNVNALIQKELSRSHG